MVTVLSALLFPAGLALFSMAVHAWHSVPDGRDDDD